MIQAQFVDVTEIHILFKDDERLWLKFHYHLVLVPLIFTTLLVDFFLAFLVNWKVMLWWVPLSK